ncbi:dystrophin-like, partial [Lingula anatina]|uniref:Dystrophin-like n=1 Tax=Lingula anatina TaxID=7574 RepID=A0A1S3JLF8_LINAN
MWNSQSFYGKLLDGWEKSETRNGVPYYINHKSERTQWDHPFLSKTLEELAEFDDVRYAAYRTAIKLRFLQKRLKLDLITLPMISRAFDDHGWSSSQDSVITCGELETVIMDIFYKTRRGKPGSLTIEQSTEILLNWLLNMYDIHRTGYVRVISAKIAMVALCSARLAEKYRYLFSQLSDYDNTISRKRLGLFLHDLLQVAELLNECLPFGGMAAIGAAIDSCFSMSRSTTGVEEFSFLDWMLLEPQTLVWLPTMHRMAAAESVKHESKCNICKEYPIIGFRYRCLKCFNYDLCQQCFLTGRVAKKHKLTHPIEEYCLATTSKEDTKAFVKTVRNNLSKRHHKKYKPRYLPIRGDGQPMEEDFTDAVPEADADMHQLLQSAARKLAQAETQAPPRQSSKMLQTDMATGPKQQVTPPKMYNIVPNEQRRELDSIIHHLEDEN